MTRGIIVEWRLWIGVGLLGLAIHASGQEWQAHQLTNLPPPWQVKECSSVADTFGNLHHYFWYQYHPLAPRGAALFYMRTDFYGNVLTDTVRLNGFAGDNPAPRCIQALTDGDHNWCVFGERVSTDDQTRGLFLTERDQDGNEVMPPTFMGYGQSWDDWSESAALDPVNHIIHYIGPYSLPGYYYRFTTSAETLLWRRPINGNLGEAFNTSMIVSPADGAAWASLLTRDFEGNSAFLAIHFGEDTSQTVYEVLPGSAFSPGQNSFGMDIQHHSDFEVGSPEDASAIIRVDSAFQNVLDYHAVNHNNPGYASALKTDSAGNCLMIWGGTGLWWGYRRGEGVWTQPPVAIDPQMEAQSFSIVHMDSQRYAFTCMAVFGGDSFYQLRLYTYGFPPNGVNSPHQDRSHENLVAYPNPFSSALQLTLPGMGEQTVILYDILGRIVWSKEVEAGVRDLKVTDSRLEQLPYGTYFLALQGHHLNAPLQIIHIK